MQQKGPSRTAWKGLFVCPIGATEPQIAANRNRVHCAVQCILVRLYSCFAQPKRTYKKPERNALIRAHYDAGATLQELADEFGLSIQRVSQIVHRKNH